ncbi:hypothetical protein [Paucisalibacillus sp. EB02]|uniref:hypothetical protein n=1 Tax=Paucisalibacillus sp. EB02 TaxID=1347087 RepID=UPI00069431C0|nr:hypothetical protein [Paucisalibacillus sp. EB02]
MVQTAAWVTSLVFMSLVIVVYAVIAWKSREKSDYEPIKKEWNKARKVYATSLVTLLLVVCIYTLRELPLSTNLRRRARSDRCRCGSSTVWLDYE